MKRSTRDLRLYKGIEAEDKVLEHLILEFPNASFDRSKTRGYDIIMTYQNKIFNIEVKSAFDVINYTYKIKDGTIKKSYKKGHFCISPIQINNGVDCFAFIITNRDRKSGDWNGNYILYYVNPKDVSRFFEKRSLNSKLLSIGVGCLKEVKPKTRIRDVLKLN